MILTDFVNETDDVTAFVLNIPEQGFKLFFELASNAGPGDNSCEIERKNAFMVQGLGHMRTMSSKLRRDLLRGLLWPQYG